MKSFNVLLTGCACFGLIGSGQILSADESPQDAPPAVAPAPVAPSEVMDLVILANSPPDLTDADLVLTLRDAIRGTEGCECDSKGIVVRPISERTFNIVANLIRSGTQERPKAADGTISEVKNSNYWQVVIPNEKQKPTGITVHYVTGKNEPVATLTEDLQPITKETARFRYSKPGLALFLTDKSWEMKEYALRYPGDNEKSLKFVPWPVGPKQFFIKLPDFKGGPVARERLFRTLAEGKIGTILVNSSEERPVTIVHADFLSDANVDDKEFISGNTYHVQFPPPAGHKWDASEKRGVARIWMLFPLTTEQKDQVLTSLKSKTMNREELSAFIRKGGTGFQLESMPVEGASAPGLQQVVTPNPKLPAPTAILSPEKQPAWYELPPQQNGDSLVYGRSFQLQKVEQWKQTPTDVWRIHVYEFEFPGEGKQEVRLLKVSRNNESSHWFPEQLKNWAAQLQKVPVE